MSEPVDAQKPLTREDLEKLWQIFVALRGMDQQRVDLIDKRLRVLEKGGTDG